MVVVAAVAGMEEGKEEEEEEGGDPVPFQNPSRTPPLPFLFPPAPLLYSSYSLPLALVYPRLALHRLSVSNLLLIYSFISIKTFFRRIAF